MALINKQDSDAPAEPRELGRDLERDNAALKKQIADLRLENEALHEQVEQLTKACEATAKGADKPVQMEKPGKFYSAANLIRDPYQERVFYPDPLRAVEVRPMNSWTDCQIKAGVLIRTG